jgi:hypothetical protein
MLKYVGNGWIDGVPARDLSDEEVKSYGKKRLVESGLYIEIKPKRAAVEDIQSEVNDGN